MKRIIVICMALFTLSFAGFAQSDAKSKAILDKVSAKYRSLDAMKANFTFTLTNPKIKLNEVQKGTLITRAKANKYQVNLGGTQIVSDGKVVWTYLKSDNEVQISNVDLSSDAVNPAKIFTLYEKGYKSKYVGVKTIGGKQKEVIELFPLKAGAAITKLTLHVDAKTNTISNAIINEKTGNIYTYAVSGFEPNVKVSDAAFNFNTKSYPGIEVVDLR
ncbi:MAG: outer membrane lipoprotein carrier protein LolA [Pedobacter sp.]|nr:MAG: outer membrane lipoprotein carrier protein LolA [Pedobacter sp.]